MSKTIATDGIITLSELSTSDAPFIYELMNDPMYIVNIGDRGIHTHHDAELYLTEGPLSSYNTLGFGLWKVTLNETLNPIGICGILQRDYLDHPDIGYATLSRYRKLGLTFKAILATLSYYKANFEGDKLYGLTQPNNKTSQALLIKVGFRHKETSIINELNTAVYSLII